MVDLGGDTLEVSPIVRGMPAVVGQQFEICNGVCGLTARQREIMGLVVAGYPSKIIAADLGISQRTVENHRASIMRRTGSTSIPALVRLVISAAVDGDVVK